MNNIFLSFLLDDRVETLVDCVGSVLTIEIVLTVLCRVDSSLVVNPPIGVHFGSCFGLSDKAAGKCLATTNAASVCARVLLQLVGSCRSSNVVAVLVDSTAGLNSE